jgi:RNA polymerase sigma-70 factor (ECF subfamily)
MTRVSSADAEATYLRLLRDHEAGIRRLSASYERDPARRQDLMQDIWLALWQALPAFRGDCSERTFVYRIAHNRAISHIDRWRLRRTEPLDGLEPMAGGARDPERALSDRERGERLHAAVTRLPFGMRQAIMLMLEGLSHREIADVLGITENSVAVRISRARAALAAELRPASQHHG